MWREKLKTYIEENGIKKKHLAESLGVSSVTLSNWLVGKTEPAPANIIKLVDTIPNLSYEDFGFHSVAQCEELDIVLAIIEAILTANGHRRQLIIELRNAITAQDFEAVVDILRRYGAQIPPAGDMGTLNRRDRNTPAPGRARY